MNPNSNFIKISFILFLGLLLFPVISVSAEKESGSIDTTAPGDYSFDLTVDNRERNYLLHVPKGFTKSMKLPLVIDVHGYTSTPEQQRRMSGLLKLSDSENFIVAWPRGGRRSPRVPNDKGWNGSAKEVFPGCCGEPSMSKWDDVKMIIAVKNDIINKLNPSKFYYTGLSNGSHMGHRFICEAPDEFDAYAITAFGLAESWEDCEDRGKKPIIYMHGQFDNIQEIEGSDNIAGEYVLSAEETMEIYAERNKCIDFPDAYKETYNDGKSWCREYEGCEEAVAYCEVDAGHVAYLDREIPVARIFWDFLKDK